MTFFNSDVGSGENSRREFVFPPSRSLVPFFRLEIGDRGLLGT